MICEMYTPISQKISKVGFPGSSGGKESTCNTGDPGSIPGSRISPGEGIHYSFQYSWASLVAQLIKNLSAMRESWFDPWVGKIPWRRAWQLTPVFLPGESPGTEESACNEGDLGSIPGLGRSLGEGKSYPHQYSFCPGDFQGLYRPWGRK